MRTDTARARAMNETRDRILEVALVTLGRDPDAGMDAIAAAGGVVRRTVYSHFPRRGDLVRALATRAADEIAALLVEITADGGSADAQWAAFVARLWPVAHRYRVLVTLRRGEYGDDIHAALRPADRTLADLIRRGQDDETFGRHLPPDLLGRLAESIVFTVADADGDVRAATITSLLVLGVPPRHAHALAGAST